jgi:hypothetical protein
MDNDPAEKLGEDMPRTLQLLTDVCSVDKNDLPDPEMISTQTQAHTFTCTKRGEERCCFNIPYWPMRYTRVLMPLNKDDRRRELYQRRVADARNKLETKAYDSIDTYLTDISSNYDSYLDLIRSTLKRPDVMFNRDMTQIYINNFNPWIASVINSNIDLQIILDA